MASSVFPSVPVCRERLLSPAEQDPRLDGQNSWHCPLSPSKVPAFTLHCSGSAGQGSRQGRGRCREGQHTLIPVARAAHQDTLEDPPGSNGKRKLAKLQNFKALRHPVQSPARPGSRRPQLPAVSGSTPLRSLNQSPMCHATALSKVLMWAQMRTTSPIWWEPWYLGAWPLGACAEELRSEVELSVHFWPALR